MIVTAALNWWNETPERLAAAVSSVASVADRIVALDGAYRRYPNATVASDDVQRQTIIDVASEYGLEPIVAVPDALWAGQVEKRTHLMRLAADKSDWVIVIDADYVVSADRRNVREQLDSGDYDVYEIPLVTPKGEYATNWHRQQTEVAQSWTPLVFRAFPGMLVEQHHWCYSALRNGERVWLWGDDDRYPKLPHGQLRDIVITHNTALRTHDEIMAARSWYNDVHFVSQMTGQEDDHPALPRPLIDTESMAI